MTKYTVRSVQQHLPNPPHNDHVLRTANNVLVECLGVPEDLVLLVGARVTLRAYAANVVQVYADLRRLEDSLDLGDEVREFLGELRTLIGRSLPRWQITMMSSRLDRSIFSTVTFMPRTLVTNGSSRLSSIIVNSPRTCSDSP